MPQTLWRHILPLFSVAALAYSMEVAQIVAPTTERFETTILGTSHENRDITAYTFGEGEQHLVFVGGLHGGYEANTVLLAYRLIEELQRNPDTLSKSLKVTVIPVANPDGLHRVVGTTGNFDTSAIPEVVTEREAGRFNANNVDLNRNFDCAWQKESMWGLQTVSAGSEAFSEPESRALRDFIQTEMPEAVIFFHSKANGVYASSCDGITLPETLMLMETYAEGSGYPAIASFDHYPITGDAEGYLTSIGIPAITIELETHTDIEWERNWRGVEAVLDYVKSINGL